MDLCRLPERFRVSPVHLEPIISSIKPEARLGCSCGGGDQRCSIDTKLTVGLRSNGSHIWCSLFSRVLPWVV